MSRPPEIPEGSENAQWPAIADRLPPGPAYLAGIAGVSKWPLDARKPETTGVWLTDHGILFGDPGLPRRRHSPLDGRGKDDWHDRTSEPLTADRAAAQAADDDHGAWVPWDCISRASIIEKAGHARVRITLDDGTEVVRRREPGFSGAPAENAWKVLLARLKRHVPHARVREFTRADLRWWHHTARVAVVVIPVLVVTGLVGNIYVERRLTDTPVERWAAGHYTSDDPVAFVYADSAAALPVPLWLAEDADEFWEIDHDRIIFALTSGGRYGSSTSCFELKRTDQTLGVHRLGRWPCDHPDTGVELRPGDRTSLEDAFAEYDLVRAQ